MQWNNRRIVIRIKRHENVHPFIQYLHSQHVELKRLAFRDKEVTFETTHRSLAKIRKARKKFYLKLSVDYMDEKSIYRWQGMSILGLIGFIIIPVICAQWIWRVEVIADAPELRDRIENTFQDTFKINTPILKRNLPDDTKIRQSLLEKNRDLAWVHIEKNGGRVNLRPLEAPKEKKQQAQKEYSHLTAAKSGVITHFDVGKGERAVAVNDTVYKGDVLVKGVVESGDSKVYVGASGAVYADYWMESKFKIPKKIKLDKLKEKKWRILFYGIHDKERESVYVQQKVLPKWLGKYVSIVEEQQSESVTIELDESKIETLILPLLHEKIIQSLPAKTIIKKENLLHVEWSDDTVEGKVLFLINENIASPQPVEQGE